MITIEFFVFNFSLIIIRTTFGSYYFIDKFHLNKVKIYYSK